MGRHSRSGNPRKLSRWLRHVGAGILLALILGGSSSGCTRRFFHRRADKEVGEVLADKDRYPQWAIEQWHVDPDPRARFADPSNPDRPPMPPDDPAAWELSPHPQKPPHAGVAYQEGTTYLDLLASWDVENRMAQAERDKSEAGAMPASAEQMPPPSPNSVEGEGAEEKLEEKRAAVPETPPSPAGPTAAPRPRPFLMTLEQAVELGLINSREYQDRREDLYLTALPVTLERFAFAGQFFLNEQIIREWIGKQFSGGPRRDWVFTTTPGLTKLFSTGALLIFQIANTTVVDLTGPKKGVVSTSDLTLDLIQPLLRGGGRAVTLEPLTQAERSLLYEIRDYAHFRKDFYAYMVAGADFSRGSVITPSALARAILPTTSAAVGIAGRAQVSPGQGTRLGTIIPPTAPSAGYLPTLLLEELWTVARQNVTRLEDILKEYQAIKEGGDVSQLQVDNVEQQLLVGRSNVLLQERLFQDSLDMFKLQLDVPLNLSLELDDEPVRPLMRQMALFDLIIKQYGDLEKQAAGYGAADKVAELRARLRQLMTSTPLVQGTRFRTEAPRQWAGLERLSDNDLDKLLRDLRQEHQRLLDARAVLEEKGRTFSEAQQRQLLKVEFDIDFATFEQLLRQYEKQPWKAVADPQRRQREQIVLFRQVVSHFVDVMGGARNERFEQVRRNWPPLPRLCVAGTDLLAADVEQAQTVAAQAALTSRFDLMNQRAQLVDAWRQIAIAANALLGTFNVQYHLESTTPPDQEKPLAFGGSRTKHQLIFNLNAPIVRKSERNNYRSALISYQRQRRALMSEEDLVVDAVRADLRQLRQLAEDYPTRRRNVELTFFTVESSLDQLRAPPAVAGPGQATQATAAALTTQLLQNLNQLVMAQNTLLTTWINYLNFRIQFYRDIELMPLDSRGQWLDQVAATECPGAAGAACTAGPSATLGFEAVQSPESLPPPQPAQGPAGPKPEEPH